jgi:hypothetical protein
MRPTEFKLDPCQVLAVLAFLGSLAKQFADLDHVLNGFLFQYWPW